jgi:hypothetical protein
MHHFLLSLRLLIQCHSYNPVSGVLGSALGDSIAQGAAYVSHRRKLGVTSSKFSFDFARTARLCTHAALLGTPINHAWFGLLDKVSAAGLEESTYVPGVDGEGDMLADSQLLSRAASPAGPTHVESARCIPLCTQNVFPSRMNHPLTALAKMGLDQAIMSPIGLCLVRVVVGKSRLCQRSIPSVVAGCKHRDFEGADKQQTSCLHFVA